MYSIESVANSFLCVIMSYNGIGLSSARGSGTNGYVQRNLSFVKPKTIHKQNYDYSTMDAPKQREPNQEILQHEKKRRVESNRI